MTDLVEAYGIEYAKPFTGFSEGEHDHPVRMTVHICIIADKIGDVIFL